MSYMSSDLTLDFPYSTSDCFAATKKSVGCLKKFKLESENLMAGTLQFRVSSGWGDITIVTITKKQDGTSSVKITSTARFPYALAFAQQTKNVQAVVEALTNGLECFTPIEQCDQPGASACTVKDRLSSLQELHESGLINDDEYEHKRAEILSAL